MADPTTASAAPVTVRRVYGLTRTEASRVVAIYRDCFVDEQRIAESSLIGTIDETPSSRRNAFLLAERDGDVVGFSFLLLFPSFRMAHLMYLAADQSGGRGGVGRALFQTLLDMCHAFDHPPRWLSVEALRPEFAEPGAARDYRERAIDFLTRQGCLAVQADFQAPPLGPFQSVVPLVIMARPIADDAVDPVLIPDMLGVLYRHVYGIEEDHPLVVHCMKSLQGAT